MITFLICYSFFVTLAFCYTKVAHLQDLDKNTDWKQSFNTLDKEYTEQKKRLEVKESLIKTLEERNKVLLETNSNQKEEVRIYRDSFKTNFYTSCRTY